jgi:ABC-2 type transport system permease protein
VFDLIWTYFRLGALNELQYRANFWVNLLQSLLALILALGAMAVVFLHTDSLAGWTPTELFILLGIYFLMSGFIRTVIEPSLERFLQDIRQGTLDFVLTKPRDAQLLVSVRKISLWSLIDVGVGAAMVSAGAGRLDQGATPAQILSFLGMLAAGAVTVYSFWMILATFTFWFVKVENILVIFQSMFQAGRWPVSIYPAALRVLLTFFVPVAFAVTVPAEALVGRLTPATLVLAILLAFGIAAVARAFWRYGVRHYSGASA